MICYVPFGGVTAGVGAPLIDVKTKWISGISKTQTYNFNNANIM